MAKFKVESGIQLLARLRRKPDIQGFYPHIFEHGPKFCEVIDIYSKISVTCLLADMISEALMPVSLGGVEAGVLFFNTDGNMNFELLLNILRNKIKSRAANKNLQFACTDDEVNDLMHCTISNLHILQIYDGNQLYTTMHSLESTLSENPNISLLVFDTLTAFYWSEQGFKLTKMDMYLRNLIRMIKKITREYKITVIFTRPEYFNSSKESIENMDGCFEKSTLEQINYYHIQLIHSNDATYKMNIRSYSKLITKTFKVVENEIKWL